MHHAHVAQPRLPVRGMTSAHAQLLLAVPLLKTFLRRCGAKGFHRFGTKHRLGARGKWPRARNLVHQATAEILYSKQKSERKISNHSLLALRMFSHAILPWVRKLATRFTERAR